MATSYWEKLRDPRWQRKRLEVMEAAGWRCECCGSDDKTFNVHHKLYIKKRDPWDYDRSQLACLCEECHEHATGLREQLDHIWAALEYDQEEALGLLKGLWLVGKIKWGEVVGNWISVNGGEDAEGIATVLNCTAKQVIAQVDSYGRLTAEQAIKLRPPNA